MQRPGSTVLPLLREETPPTPAWTTGIGAASSVSGSYRGECLKGSAICPDILVLAWEASDCNRPTKMAISTNLE